MDVTVSSSSYAMMSTLSIRNVNVNDSGTYQCIGRNVGDKSLFIDEAILEVTPGVQPELGSSAGNVNCRTDS